MPSRRARPTIAPSAPACSSASRSSSERMPPAASTGKPERSTTPRTSSTSGPSSVPSRSIAVHRSRETPAAAQRSIASSSVDAAFRPAARSHDAVAHVERDHQPLSERSDELVQQRPRRRADDDAARAGAHEGLRVGDRANAAGGLHRRRRRRMHERADHDGADQPGPRAVQVDDVDPLGPFGREAPGELRRLAVLRDALIVALLEADSFPAEQVDCRNDFHMSLTLCYYANTIRWERLTPHTHGRHRRSQSSSRRSPPSARRRRWVASCATSARCRSWRRWRTAGRSRVCWRKGCRTWRSASGRTRRRRR